MPDWLSRPWGQGALVVLGFAVSGGLAGLGWHAWWEPSDGVVLEGEWLLPGPDLAISSTAQYVAIALPLGVLLGVAVSLIPRHEVATLVAVVAGSALAAWLMYSVGNALGPPDPRPLAAGEVDFTSLPSDLVLAAGDDSRNPFRSPALLALPVGALTGLCAAYLLGPHRYRRD